MFSSNAVRRKAKKRPRRKWKQAECGEKNAFITIQGHLSRDQHFQGQDMIIQNQARNLINFTLSYIVPSCGRIVPTSTPPNAILNVGYSKILYLFDEDLRALDSMYIDNSKNYLILTFTCDISVPNTYF